jgi:hypothetical protein
VPVKIRKKNGYEVSTPSRTTAKSTTKKKAEAQARLLRGIEHGWVPSGVKRGSKPKKRRA